MDYSFSNALCLMPAHWFPHQTFRSRLQTALQAGCTLALFRRSAWRGTLGRCVQSARWGMVHWGLGFASRVALLPVPLG